MKYKKYVHFFNEIKTNRQILKKKRKFVMIKCLPKEVCFVLKKFSSLFLDNIISMLYFFESFNFRNKKKNDIFTHEKFNPFFFKFIQDLEHIYNENHGKRKN